MMREKVAVEAVISAVQGELQVDRKAAVATALQVFRALDAASFTIYDGEHPMVQYEEWDFSEG